MTTQFKHWTERVTDGTSDLFWLGKGLLAVKDERKERIEFTLSMFNVETDEFVLYQPFTTKQEWKEAYRQAREVRKMTGEAR